MPYESNKQAAYMHIHHPEIAADWSAKGHGYVKGGKNDPHRKKKGRVRKSAPIVTGRRGWLEPLLIGTGAGVAANQVPPVQDVVREERKKAKKRGRVKKSGYEDLVSSDNPYFNHEVARKAFDLVMKMDDDTAEMFTEMVIGELYEDDIAKNLRTLQRHLNEVVFKRLTDTKAAMRRVIAKGDHDGAVEMAQAIDRLEEIIKVGAAQRFGYTWREGDFRRDPTTGQFQTKVTHTQKKPFSNRVADGMGLVPTDPTDRGKYASLSQAQKAQYQDEYKQLSQFLATVTASGGAGDHAVHLRLRDRLGNEFRQPLSGGPEQANSVLLDPRRTLIGIEATPTTLTMGGAAFGLAQALGADYGAQTAGRIGMADRGVGGLKSFEETWNYQPNDLKTSNAQLYNRVGAAGQYVGAVAPPGSKTAMAAKVAEIVGSHGAEAEAVIGPSARKTAYRYRGVERAPDKGLVQVYGRAVQAAKVQGVSPEETEIVPTRRGEAPRAEELGMRRSGTRVKAKGGGPVAPSLQQMANTRLVAAHRAPTWEERANGREVIRTYLNSRVPTAELYRLQLASGHTPPSEGIMINRDGQITSQATGYGDDHYLPFNLKNLKSLKGGEYIRTRSVGGLTSEDIYTGLAAGARRVTVVSRSGTFSIEFEPDVRGARRHSDKAKRMTRRYEQLLDAVQSNQVTKQPVPPAVEQAIRSEVSLEMRGESRAAIKAAVTERIKEYRQDPDMGPEDEKISRLVYEQGMKDNPSRDEQEWLRQARNLVASGKAFNYKLDADGYMAAQDALAEQFPYYIRSQPLIERDDEIVSRETDKGYVEPGRNRPTGAQAGLFGTETNQAEGKAIGSQKFSASQANFQRGRLGPGRGDVNPRSGVLRRTRSAPPAEEAAEEAAATPGARRPGQRELTAAERALQQDEVNESALELFTELGQMPLGNILETRPVLNQSPEAFATAMTDPEVMEQFRTAVTEEFDARQSNMPQRAREAYRKFKRASGDLNARGFSGALAAHWTPEPMGNWQGLAYQDTPDPELYNREVSRLNDATPSLTTGRALSTLSDDELRGELHAIRQVRLALTTDPTLAQAANSEERKRIATRIFGSEYDPRAVQLFTGSSERMDTAMENIHRMRYLNRNRSTEARAASGPSTRQVSPAEVSASILNDSGMRAAVEQRQRELSRYRNGMDILEEHPTEGVDTAIADAAHQLQLIDEGLGNQTDVESFLNSTADLAAGAPRDFSQLTRQQYSLYRSQPELFTTDPEGVVRPKPRT